MNVVVNNSLKALMREIVFGFTQRLTFLWGRESKNEAIVHPTFNSRVGCSYSPESDFG